LSFALLYLSLYLAQLLKHIQAFSVDNYFDKN